MKQIILSLTCIALIWITFITACKKEGDVYHNKPPIANAGKDQTITIPSCVGSASAELDGTGTSDPDNNTLGYQWRELWGPAPVTMINSNSATVQLENITVGTYAFELTVADAEGKKAKDTVRITVTGATKEYDLDITFEGTFFFQDNYEDCYYYPCSYFDFTRFDGMGQFPPLGQFNVSITEFADSASLAYASNSYVGMYSNTSNLYLGGSLSVNFKKLIQQGGGSFNGSFKINNGSAQSCTSNVFDNLPALTVTGTLYVPSNVVSLRINGKAIF